MNDGVFGSLGGPAFGTQLDSVHSAPASSSSFSFFSQNTPATPSFSDNGVSVAHMKLADLFVNPHVEDLFNKWTDANGKAIRYVEEQHRLLQQISSLQNDVFMLRTELAATQRKLEG